MSQEPSVNGSVMAAVMQTIEERKRQMPEKSYVVRLLRAGTDAICCKLAEEAGETIKAAREQDRQRLIEELCDVYFHSFVLMAQKEITLADIENELARRHGIGGLEEKASRKG